MSEETTKKSKTTRPEVSERLTKTKPKGWEIPFQEKFFQESFRDRNGENGLFRDSGPLCVSNNYIDIGKSDLIDPRSNSRFRAAITKCGTEALFSLQSSCFVGSMYEPVDTCMQRYQREKNKRAKSHQTNIFKPASDINDKIRKQCFGRDIYLIEVDSTVDRNTIKDKINDRETERINRINYLRSHPMSKCNMKTSPAKIGTYGCIGTTIGKFPPYKEDNYNNPEIIQRQERIESEKKMGNRKAFYSKTHVTPEGTFTLIKNLYPTNIVFPEKPVELRVTFKTQWKQSSPVKFGNSGYPAITIGPYPPHFIPNKADNLPQPKPIKTVWYSGEQAKSKPSPSIRLNKINISRKI